MRKLFLISILLVSLFIDYTIAQTWKSFSTDNSPLPENMVNSVTVSTDNTIWFATDNGLASFKDNTWKVYESESGLNNCKLNYVSFLPSNSESLWVATNTGAVVLQVNSINEFSDPQYITKSGNGLVSDTVTVVDLDGLSDTWIGTDKGLSVITNSGIYNFTEDNGFENSEINDLKSLSDNWVHVGTNGDGVNRLKYNGVDGVTSASKIITTWSGLASDTVLAVYVTDDTLKWYCTPQGVSTFHGDNTKDINNWWRYNTFTSGIIDNYVRTIVRDNEGNTWFGTKIGLSKLLSDGTTWQSYTEDDGLISNNIFDLAVDKDNNVWVATDKGVSYYSDSPNAVRVNNISDYKIRITNYPNPFNPTTTIEYTIPAVADGSISLSMKIKLVVYDALGNEITTLVNKRQIPGTYKAVWKASEFSSGVYYYKIESNLYSQTGKMLLLK